MICPACNRDLTRELAIQRAVYARTEPGLESFPFACDCGTFYQVSVTREGAMTLRITEGGMLVTPSMSEVLREVFEEAGMFEEEEEPQD